MIKKFKGLEKVKKIHMIGIGGVSMSGIAIILQKAGYEVTGSDKNEGDMIDILTKNGIPVFIGSNAEWVKDADIVVYTSAINQHDPEFVRAKALNKPLYERAKFLGILLYTKIYYLKHPVQDKSEENKIGYKNSHFLLPKHCPQLQHFCFWQRISSMSKFLDFCLQLFRLPCKIL